jgi:hypothetical protein
MARNRRALFRRTLDLPASKHEVHAPGLFLFFWFGKFWLIAAVSYPRCL